MVRRLLERCNNHSILVAPMGREAVEWGSRWVGTHTFCQNGVRAADQLGIREQPASWLDGVRRSKPEGAKLEAALASRSSWPFSSLLRPAGQASHRYGRLCHMADSTFLLPRGRWHPWHDKHQDDSHITALDARGGSAAPGKPQQSLPTADSAPVRGG